MPPSLPQGLLPRCVQNTSIWRHPRGTFMRLNHLNWPLWTHRSTASTSSSLRMSELLASSFRRETQQAFTFRFSPLFTTAVWYSLMLLQPPVSLSWTGEIWRFQPQEGKNTLLQKSAVSSDPNVGARPSAKGHKVNVKGWEMIKGVKKEKQSSALPICFHFLASRPPTNGVATSRQSTFGSNKQRYEAKCWQRQGPRRQRASKQERDVSEEGHAVSSRPLKFDNN